MSDALGRARRPVGPTRREARLRRREVDPGLRDVFVMPFYLAMTSLHRLPVEEQLLDRVARAATVLTESDVVRLLNSTNWRDQVMGAWYALAQPLSGDVRRAVLETLATRCGGLLTSPPLAMAAVILAGRDGVPAIVSHVERTEIHGYGDAGICAAAAEFALPGERSPLPPPSQKDRAEFGNLIHIAARFVAPAARWTLPGQFPDEDVTGAASTA